MLKLCIPAMAVLVATPSIACSVRDIEIKSMKAGYVDECSSTPCYSLKGVAVLQNRCKNAVGIQLKLTAYDKAGTPLATTDFWPASVRNVPPGEYTFSLDHVLDYHRGVARFVLTPIDIRSWR